jgi:hypothetical protein
MAINGHDVDALEGVSSEVLLEKLRERTLKPSQRAILAAQAVPRVSAAANNSKSPKIQHTTNYDLFQKNEFNRDVSKVDALLVSMKKHGFIPAYAIHVTRWGGGKLIVKGGHHRLEAAKRLGIAVYYIVCDDEASVVELEQATTPWLFVDYVRSYARAGSAPHIAITEYCERTGISMSQAASMLGGESASSNNMARRAKVGTFQVKDTSHAEAVGEVVVELRKMSVRFASQQCFVSALSSVMWLEEFSASTFLRRVAANLHLMIRQATVAQYLNLIDQVYNHKAQQKIALAFLAREAAKARNAVSKAKKKKASND